MKDYPFLEAMGAADEKFLEEVFEDSKDERRQISMSKKKIVTIFIAAALVLSLGATAAAAGWSRLSQLGDYFDTAKEGFRLPDEVPIINNPEVYAKEVVTGAVTEQTEATKDTTQAATAEYTPPAPGEAKITTVSMAGHTLYVTIDFNATGFNIPDELPENTKEGEICGFEYTDVNFLHSIGYMTDLLRSGDIFTSVYSFKGIEKLPEDEIVIKLHNFGYIGYFDGGLKKQVVLADVTPEVRLPVSEINIIEPIKSKNTVNIMGADFGVELSIYDLIIYSDFDSLYAAGLSDENGFTIDSNGGDGKNLKSWDYFDERHLELHMLDGTVYTEEVFRTGGSHLVDAMRGGRDADAHRCMLVWSFSVPIDTDQIDYIMINDSRFDF